MKKVYGIYDPGPVMMLARPVLLETFENKEDAEQRLAEISHPEYEDYSAVDPFFYGAKHGNQALTSFEEFEAFAKTVPGFVLIAEHTSSSYPGSKLVVYDKSKTILKDPKGGYGCVVVNHHKVDGTDYYIEEIEVKGACERTINYDELLKENKQLKKQLARKKKEIDKPYDPWDDIKEDPFHGNGW